MLTVQEYNTIVKLYSDNLYRYSVKSISDSEAAKDVVQNVFLKLWQRRDKVEVEKCKGLLFKMAHQTIIDTYRSNKARTEREAIPVNTRSNNTTGFETRELLDIAFKQLSEKYKSILLLRDYEGYAYEEIAGMLDMTLANVKVNIFRARKQMQSILHELENEVA